jgi:hypothetical protein
MRPKSTLVVCGFPGVGKSTLVSRHQGLMVLDSDSSKFSWTKTEPKTRHPAWPGNYIAHIQDNIGVVDLILVSTHDEVRCALIAAGVPFTLVYPGPEMEEEYIQRYIDRGSDASFITLLRSKYQEWIAALARQQGCTHVALSSGQYLSDVICCP